MSGSISQRFFVSFIASSLRAGINVFTGLLLARWLGPDDFGRMAFLLASFMAFKQLLDMGTSSAFFTFLSQRPRGKFFVSLFWRWIGVQFLVSLGLVALLLPNDLVHALWKGEARYLILLALIATFMQGVVWPIASQMAEANRKTFQVQRLNTLVVSVHLLVVLVLWMLGQLALPLLFVAVAFEWALASWLAAKLYKTNAGLANLEDKEIDTTQSVWREFWSYCAPFIPHAWLGFFHDFGDRWMLQHWGGSKEQAHFAVAQLLSAAVLLAASSILRVFWKEVAEAHHADDRQRVKYLFLKISRLLYFFGAFIAGALLPWATEILELTAGPEYLSGATTLMVMLIYPVHQSMGQISSAMLYATERSRLQVILNMFFMSINLIVAYIMMAPEDAYIPGFGLASQGLAWKMVVLQILEVNVAAWFISRIFGWKFQWFYQPAGLIICIFLGFSAQTLVSWLVGWLVVELQFFIAGLIYLISVIALLFYLPWLAGLERSEILAQVRRFIVR